MLRSDIMSRISFLKAKKAVPRLYSTTSPPLVASLGSRRGLVIATAAASSIAVIYISRDIWGHSSHLETSKSSFLKGKKEGDLLISLNGKIYDFTEFAPSHPGGEKVIIAAAGKDASDVFNMYHPTGTLETNLPPEACLGASPKDVPSFKLPEKSKIVDPNEIPGLEYIIGLPDFIRAAQLKLTDKAWAYYASGGTDEVSLRLNRSVWNDILFRPRVMRDMTSVDTKTEYLGTPTSVPFSISACGMAKLSDPEGEVVFSRMAGPEGVIQMISTNASVAMEDIVGGSTTDDQTFIMQLYVNKDRAKSEALLKRINAQPKIKAIFATVDAATPGKRENDERASISPASESLPTPVPVNKAAKGIGKSTGAAIDPSLSWKDIKWLRANTKLPIGLKGVQSVEDILLAVEHGIDAVHLSNHGGRALDGSPPAIYQLLELQRDHPEILKEKKIEIYVDGGVWRGTDIVKAVCLGAKGVFVGRPFMYALTYGEEGVKKAIEILRDEVEGTMKLLGVKSIDELGPHLVNTKRVDPFLSDPVPKIQK